MKMLKKVFNSEIKGIDEKTHTLTAFVSTGARDRMDEVLSPNGADLKSFKKNPVVLWAHNYSQPPIGKALWIKREGEGIVSKVQFANTEFAQEVFNLYKDGFMKAFSVGFIPKEHEDGDGKKSPRRTYNKWEMLEYSAVPVPANPEALALAISKGVLKDEKLKSMMEAPVEPPKEEEEQEQQPMKKEEPLPDHVLPCPECGTAIDISTLTKDEQPNTDLLEEVNLLKDKNTELENTILGLRFRLLEASKKKEASLSEMTDNEILKKIEEIGIGVIRKITGKVN